MPTIDFPLSTAPGVNPGESGGRLINAYAEPQKKDAQGRSQTIWRRVPGCRPVFDTSDDTWRGQVLVGTQLYVANGDKVDLVTKSGTYTVTPQAGTLSGTGKVLMARNMAATPDILIVHSAGMAKIAAGTVSSFSDADLPAVNSICFLDGYFFVTSEAGACYASGVNAITFAATDFTRAESQPDGLYRAIPSGRDLLLMGVTSIDIYSNTANPTGFPFSRYAAKAIGLWGRYAVAGFEEGFTGPVTFAASDNSVRMVQGTDMVRISDPDLEDLIRQVEDRDTLEASVYVDRGRPVFVLSSPDWTWEYNFATGKWNERRSIGADRWLAHGGIFAFQEWLTFDTETTDVYRIDPNYKYENLAQIPWEMRSVQHHRFPARAFVKRISFDFVVGVGIDTGIDPIETDPQVRISWSIDGGRTFGEPLIRSLGTQGEVVSIDCRPRQKTHRWGIQFKLEISDPIEIGLMGGAQDINQIAAAGK